MKIAIILPGTLPMPPVKGGAVENLVYNILIENENTDLNNKFIVFSRYEEESVLQSKKFKKSKFIYYRVPKIVTFLDKVIFCTAKYIFNKKNSQSYSNILSRLYYLKKVSDNLKKENYDRVVLENHTSIFLALKWHKNYKKYENKYYYHAHNDIPSLYGCKNIINKSKSIICVSQYIADLYINKLNLEPNRVNVLRNCINERMFNKDISFAEKKKIRSKYNIKDDEKILLFVGRIIPEKGVSELISSLKLVKTQKYKLIIIGASLFDSKIKTKYEEEVEHLASELNDKIIFSGYVNYDEIYKFYKIADFAVLPSIWNDPAPLTIIECLVCGLPIITTNSGGIPEYAVDNSAIILERNEELIDNLSKNIDVLLLNEEKLIEMKKQSKIASNNLTVGNYYNNFLNKLK